MKLNTRQMVLGFALFASLGIATITDAHAIDLDTARAQGLVGERFDGLIGATTPNPSPDVLNLIQQVNQGRMAKYRDSASNSGTDINTFRRIMGEKIISTVPSGTQIMGPNGQWMQK